MVTIATNVIGVYKNSKIMDLNLSFSISPKNVKLLNLGTSVTSVTKFFNKRAFTKAHRNLSYKVMHCDL